MLLARVFSYTSALLLIAGIVPADAQTSESPFTSAARYDEGRRLTGAIAPDPDGTGPLRFAATRNSYDVAGRLVTVETGELAAWQADTITPAGWTGFTVFRQTDITYDLFDRKIKEIVSAQGTPYLATQYSYDALGRLECTAIRMNPAIFSNLPASACDLGTAGSQGPDRITRNEYDAAGQLLKIVKAYGTALAQDYATYTYSPNGKRTSVRDANGNLASMTYDGFDRQNQWNFPSKTNVGSVSGDDYEAYSYDANGNRTSLRRRDGRTLTFAYDALNRITSKVVPDGCAPIQLGGCTPASATRDVFYGYDLRGLQTYARFDGPGGEGVTTAYTGFGEIASSTTAMGGYSRTIGSTYDADSIRIRMTYPDSQFINYYRDGLDRLYYADLNAATQLFYPPYDAAGRVSILYRLVGGNWAIPTSYGYDVIDRLTSMAHIVGGGGVTSNFSYNPASQMTSRSRDNDAYAFTGYVNVNRGYGVNGLNQYTSAGPAVFAYDANGNLTSDGTTSYIYDAENRLVSASTGATLAYDPLGRLWQTAGGPAGLTQFLYEGDQLTAEYDGAGNMLRRYVHSDGEDDPLVWYEGAGTSAPRYLYADHQGSIVGVANASGTIATINAYDEYGIPKTGNSITSSGRFQYTGQAWIPELGMYHYKARIYSPTLGRFLQTDPIGYDDQINLYAYVGNDPVNVRDPSGLEGDFWDRAGQVIQGLGEVVVGGVGAGVGIAVTTGSVAVEVPTLGTSTVGVAGGVILTAGSAALAADGSRRIGNAILGGATISESRSRPPGPLPEAGGRPHSIPDGRGGYTTYPTGSPNEGKQYRPAPGKPHGPIDRPNVKEWKPNRGAPDGVERPGKPEVRPPNPDEKR